MHKKRDIKQIIKIAKQNNLRFLDFFIMKANIEKNLKKNIDLNG